MKYLSIIFVVLIFTSATCRKKDSNCPDDSHYGITYHNNSPRRLNFYVYWHYPDTTIAEYNPKGFGMLLPGEFARRGIIDNRSCWESVLKDGKKEYIYIFDEDSLQAIPWDIVRATNRGLLERRVIDLKYLQANDFIVTYP